MNKTAVLAAAGAVTLMAFLLRNQDAFFSARLSAEQVKQMAESTVEWHFPAVSPLMLRAMVEIESSRNPLAVRHEPHIRWKDGRKGDDSIGLMQTLVSTAQWMATDMGANAYGIPQPQDLLVPEISMYMGASYVNWLATYAGQARGEQWIVESYNGGPNNSDSQTQNHWAKYQKAKQRLIQEGV
ncbi:MAG: transglycosylase SLT domain-containing protein [Alphaproteobacteria bacterium]|nr:transglycosylase SLT domain-containing protein [Alphaproteobacteria bacterium]MDD9919044.1 transglycosylase SLT domain-containing protein [Alphaproteobacteria bacterium]